ncbi:MAG TPA: PQQ-binding-like beta-propeller repeat protein [Candidatus Cybelea sp.]|jgi:alcohol dehydrogenase (cytochrome c)|nr:PQQ-binding-like beta-propeller repeat protein [Candidatus Cybelea sp.]
MRFPLRSLLVVAVVAAAAWRLSPGSAAPVKSIAGSTGSQGWYSQTQAAQGATIFAAKCAVCHGAKLQGGAGPALAGTQFFLRYRGQPLSALWSIVHTQMPLNAPGTLSTAQSLAVVAYILQKNGFPAGASPIVGHYDVTRIIPAAAPGTAAASESAATPAPMVVKQPSSDLVSQAQLDTADGDADNWLTYGKGYRGQRYSTLSEISTTTAPHLHPVCSVRLAPEGSFEASPVVYGGTIYVTTTTGTFAIDGRTCAKRWSYQYHAVDIEAGANNKGLAIAGGRAIRGTADGHLIALDLRTGALLWNRKIMDSSTGASAMAAPLIWHGLVFMGAAGGDVGVNGEVSAYRVTDGIKVWSFSTLKTPTAHGGGGVWTYLTLDPQSGTLYVPVGNPGPDFDSGLRPGANLFTTGIVALDATSGTLRWWYQTQPNDDHDWDATGSTEFQTGGGTPMLAATAKDGLLHLLDLADGKLRTKTATTTIANASAPMTTAGTHYCPGVTGGSEWNGAAWSPKTQLVYVNSVDWCVTVKLTKLASIKNITQTAKAAAGAAGFGGGIPVPDPMTAARGWITAVDPATGQVRWHLKMDTPMVAALTPTAGGLLFTGDLNGNLLALAADSGKVVYRYDTKNAIAGGIVTYNAGGKQYVAAAAGNTSFVAWKVTGKPTLFIFGL